MPSTQVRETPAATDPIADLIGAYVPSLTTPRLVRTPSQAAEVDWAQRQGRPGYGTGDDFPRGLIPIHGIRCGEYL